MTRQDGFEAWFTASREDTADLLRAIGDGIDDGHVEWGTVAVDLPETVDVAVECEPEADGYEFELTLEWAQDDVRAEAPAAGDDDTAGETHPDGVAAATAEVDAPASAGAAAADPAAGADTEGGAADASEGVDAHDSDDVESDDGDSMAASAAMTASDDADDQSDTPGDAADEGVEDRPTHD